MDIGILKAKTRESQVFLEKRLESGGVHDNGRKYVKVARPSGLVVGSHCPKVGGGLEIVSREDEETLDRLSIS